MTKYVATKIMAIGPLRTRYFASKIIWYPNDKIFCYKNHRNGPLLTKYFAMKIIAIGTLMTKSFATKIIEIGLRL